MHAFLLAKAAADASALFQKVSLANPRITPP
jgi:hypothetical protein